MSFYLTPEGLSWSDYVPERPESVMPVLDLSGEWQYRAGMRNGTIRIPSSYAGYDGIVTFTRRFTIPEAWKGRHIILKFFGIQHRASIHLNGAILGTHEVSGIPFEIPVPGRLVNFGSENEITIEVDNRKLSKTGLPLKSSLFPLRNFGGITRELFLIALPVEGINRAAFREVSRSEESEASSRGASLELNLAISLLQQAGPAELNITMKGKEGKALWQHRMTLIPQDDDQPLHQTIRFSLPEPRRWSPDDPYLYWLQLTLQRGDKQLDQVNRSIGLRPQDPATGLLRQYGLFTLQGITRVGQWPQCGITPSRQKLQDDLKLLKELGVNFVHCAYFPPHPYFINVCDSLGILLFIDIPVFGASTDLLTTPGVQNAAISYIEELQDWIRIHPSVVAIGWGSRLEHSAISDDGILNDWTRQLNADLPLYVHTVAAKSGDPGIHFLGPHSLIGSNSESPIVEFSLSLTDFTDDDPEIMQAKTLTYFLSQLGKNRVSFVVNGFSDWFGDKPLLFNPPVLDTYQHLSGLTSASRQPRKAFYVLQNYTRSGIFEDGNRSATHASEPPWEFLAVGLFFTAIGLWLMRVDNLFRQNLRRAMLHSEGFFSDIRDRRFLQGSSTLFLILFLGMGFGNLIATVLYANRMNAGFSALAEHAAGFNGLMLLLHTAAWHPTRGIIIAAAVFVGISLITAILIRLGSPGSPRRLSLVQAFHIFFWSGIPVLSLLPLSAFYLRLEEIPTVKWLTGLIMAVALIWYYIRLIFSTGVGYRSGLVRPVLVLTGIPLLFLAAYAVSLNATRQSLYYIEYIINLFSCG